MEVWSKTDQIRPGQPGEFDQGHLCCGFATPGTKGLSNAIPSL